jgi:hypothetical protein
MRKLVRSTARLVRQFGSVGLVAVATAALSLAGEPRAQAASLTSPAAKAAMPSGGSTFTLEARFGDGRGGHRGGGGGGFRGGGPAAHGVGGFRGGGAPVFHGGAIRSAPVRGGVVAAPAFRGGGIRAFHGGGGYRFTPPAIARPAYYAPIRHHWRPRHHFRPRNYGYDGPRYYPAPYYYGPRRFCRIVWTYYGPRKICRTKPWRHHWRHHHRRHHYWHRHWRVYW